MTAGPRQSEFEAVVAEVYVPLQRYLRRRCEAADFEDVLNDALLTIWRRLDDLPEGAVLPWTYGVARRCLANHRRGAARRLRLVRRVSSEVRTASPHSVAQADVALHEALDRLGELDREVVRLWAWEQLEPREIAEVIDSTPNAVSVRLSRIRRRLATELARQDRVPAGHKPEEAHPELEP